MNFGQEMLAWGVTQGGVEAEGEVCHENGWVWIGRRDVTKTWH